MRLMLEVVAAVAFLFLILAPAWQYSELPERIPTHFGPSGQPDAWRGKANIWLLPALGAAMFGLVTGLTGYAARKEARQSPPEWAEQRAGLMRSFLAAIKAQTMCLFAFITQQTIEVAHGRAEALGPVFFVLLALLVPIIVVYAVRRSQLR